jgi:dynein heavy chain 1
MTLASQLLTASSIPALREALDAIFTHINKKLRISPYPIPRALLLAQALSRDLRDRLVSLLQPLQILTMKPYEKFKSGVVDEAQALFDLGWGENIREFVSVCREMSRKRSERFIPVKVGSVPPLKSTLFFTLLPACYHRFNPFTLSYRTG